MSSASCWKSSTPFSVMPRDGPNARALFNSSCPSKRANGALSCENTSPSPDRDSRMPVSEAMLSSFAIAGALRIRKSRTSATPTSGCLGWASLNAPLMFIVPPFMSSYRPKARSAAPASFEVMTMSRRSPSVPRRISIVPPSPTPPRMTMERHRSPS